MGGMNNKEYLSLLLVVPGYILFIWQIIEIVIDKQWGVLLFAVAFFTPVTVLLVAFIYDIHCRARFGG